MASKAAKVRPQTAAQIRCASLVVKLRRSGKIKFSKQCRSGVFLFREGETAHGVYVLCKGRAKVSVSSSEGKTLALRIAKPGDLLGLSAGLTARSYQTTAEMIEDGLVEFIPREVFWGLIRSQEPFTVQLLQLITDEFFEFIDHARLLLLSHSAAEKLARLLVKWADESVESCQCSSRCARVVCDLTHDQIAEIVGSSRETVSRLFGEFTRQNMITWLDDEIHVENRNALEAVAKCRWMGNQPDLRNPA